MIMAIPSVSIFEYNAQLPGSLSKKENMGFEFDNNVGKKPKRKLKEEDGDGEWGSGLNLKPKSKRSMKQKPQSSIPTPDMPNRYKRHILEDMGGSGLVLVIQKTLFYSDVNHTASRFSVPFSQVKSRDFLTKTEADDLAHKKPISLYVMTESWNSVVETNKLKKGGPCNSGLSGWIQSFASQ
ncbi:hypothetical protein F3Y22_tig00112402pilonHSYRG00123 [Hibiscus syriacus]|uniref:Uncharacterized protein n=1 Tax=Hibiscus syriacus TaxID=106335 RepID=A0A6A2WZU8_HIBSY|nr:hypothetical protein F3Y22_tig00112402pilonHSYRG00123 [Hibiscus syriacus]